MSDGKRREARSALGGKGAVTERRAFELTAEVRGEGDDAPEGMWRFRGLASRSGVSYEVYDGWGGYAETVNPGAFKTTLAEDPTVLLLVMHDGLPLASTRSGTMRLWESDRGLEVEADLDMDDPRVQSIRSSVERGDLSEMSFGFRVMGQVWSEDYMDRTITAVNLHRGDASFVNYGANPYTSTAASDEMESNEHIDDDDMDDDDDHRVALLVQQQREEELLFDLAA